MTTASVVFGTAPASDSRSDTRSVRDLGSAADGVGHKLCLVTGLERLDHGEREADLGLQCTEDQPLAPRRRHSVTERLTLERVRRRRSIGLDALQFGSDRWQVGPLVPDSTPMVESTIGTSNAFAALASQRVWSSIRAAGVSERIDSNWSL